LSGFYLAVLGDAHYFERACSFVSPRFHVREVEGASRPPDGGCPAMAAFVHDGYQHRLTAGDFWVERVNVRGRTADAVTSLGRAELEVVGGEWKLLAVDAPKPPDGG
jgi:hypothetical protein